MGEKGAYRRKGRTDLRDRRIEINRKTGLPERRTGERPSRATGGRAAERLGQ